MTIVLGIVEHHMKCRFPTVSSLVIILDVSFIIDSFTVGQKLGPNHGDYKLLT